MVETLLAPGKLKFETETPYLKMRREGDIIYCEYTDNLHLTLEIAKVCVHARIYFTGGNSFPLLIDMRGIRSATKEARTYMASIGAMFLKAGALIIGSAVNRTIGNVFLAIDKPPVPVKLFTDEVKAREWLQQFI